MSSFSDYMDQIKASPELKKETAAYVMEKMQRQLVSSKSVIKYKNTRTRRLIITAVSTIACLLLALSSHAFYNAAINYVCVDINPSVELGINVFGRVVQVEAYNDDGKRLLRENRTDIKYLQISEAVDIIVIEAEELGFIAKDGSTVIALTAEANRSETAQKLSSKCENSITALLSSNNIPAVVYTDYTALDLRREAEAVGISPGKYKLLLILQSLDPEIILDEHKNARVTDIITQIDGLASLSEQSGQSVTGTAEVDNIRIVASKLKETNDNKSSGETKNTESETLEEEQVQKSADKQDNKESQGSDNQDNSEKDKKDADKNENKGSDKNKQGSSNSEKHEDNGKELTNGKKTGKGTNKNR